MNRREALRTLCAAGSAVLLGAPGVAQPAARTRMGVVTYAFGIHSKDQWSRNAAAIHPAIALLEESNRLGAAGIQVDFAGIDIAQAAELRRRADRYGMYIEASISPPKSQDDVARFEKSVLTAQKAGATLARTVILPGRRYEEFKSLADFRKAERHGVQMLQWAEPILERHRFYLAVENHKDQRIAEKLEMIKGLNSEFVGLCLDFGNSFTLMEEPLDVVQAYAPYALTAHFKDQAVRGDADGFLFADVPLGEGFLDLPGLIAVLRQAKPRIHLNLELITRDALKVPCLKDDFWATMPDTPARNLARVMETVRTRSSPKPFVEISALPVEQQLALELSNVEQSFAYAREHLGLI